MSKIVLLPNNIGEKVIKVVLSKNGESERALLFVPKGGCIYEHSHKEGENPNSEAYIHLLNRGDIVKENANTAVAGYNSPTNRTIHGVVRDKDYPQIILAYKKGQERGAWEETYSNLNNLGVIVKKIEDGKIKIENKTATNTESIIIDTVSNTVLYSDGNTQEFDTLDNLSKKVNNTTKKQKERE